MNYFEHLNYAFSIAQFKNLPTSTRITHLAILHKWNAFRRTASFSLSDRELQSLTGLGSSAITAAKRHLKNLGLIDFKATKAHTIYKVPSNAHFESAVSAQTAQNSTQPPNFPTAKSKNNINEEEKSTREGGEDFEFERQPNR